MQPCPVCRNVGVDANGYCTTCSTYLGVPQAEYGVVPPGQPTPTTPYPAYPQQQAGYPASGVPYSAAPASPVYAPGVAGGYPPASAPPVSAPRYAQASAPPYAPAGYPYAAPVEPPRKSHVGAIVASLAAVVIVIAAIVVVLVVKAGGSDNPPVTLPTATAKVSASPSAADNGIDQCIVGSWKVVADQFAVDFPNGFTGIPMTLHNNYKITWSADGTAEVDFEAYDTQTDWAASQDGHTFQYSQNGSGSYNFTTKSGQMTTFGTTVDGDYEYWIDDVTVASGNASAVDGVWEYTCGGDTMSRRIDGRSQRLQRL